MEDHVMHFKTLNSAFRVWNEVVYKEYKTEKGS